MNKKKQEVVELATKEKKTDEEPRTGVFVCKCGLNIGGVVDCDKVAEIAKDFPNVVHTQANKYTCSDTGQEDIIKKIKDHNLLIHMALQNMQ